MRYLNALPVPEYAVDHATAGRVVAVAPSQFGAMALVECGPDVPDRDRLTAVLPGNTIPDGARFVGPCTVGGAPAAVYARPGA